MLQTLYLIQIIDEETMKPIGPLMQEHRLIERMVHILEKELIKIRETGKVDSYLIFSAIDFFRVYADRTHHGKEEDILFRELSKKHLSESHKELMDTLVDDHIVARKTVGALMDANNYIVKVNKGSTKEIILHLEKLVALYVRHISTEDKEFFYPCLEYFSKEEQDDILHVFWEFDRKMIHEKYTQIVSNLEQ